MDQDKFKSKLTASHRTQSKDGKVKLSLAEKAGFWLPTEKIYNTGLFATLK
jgi:hypothetical protein